MIRSVLFVLMRFAKTTHPYNLQELRLSPGHTFRRLFRRLSGLLLSAEVNLIRYILPARDEAPHDEIRRILIIKLDELGDTILALPMFQAVREAFPDAEITLIVNDRVAGLFAGVRDFRVLNISNVLSSRLMRPLILPLRLLRFARRYLGDGFDLCLLPRRDADDVYATILGYFSKSKRRVSFAENSTPRKALLNRGFDKLLTDVITGTPVQHEVLSNLDLLRSIDIHKAYPPKFHVPIPASDIAFAHQHISSARPAVAICPTSGHSILKQWGSQRFAEVATMLTRSGYSVVLVGGPGDAELGSTIASAAAPHCLNLIGQTTLTQMAAVLSACSAFVGNDAGPTHLASALGIPTVGIFGPSCHHRYGPWGTRVSVISHEISCSPCQMHTLDRCQTCIYSEPRCLRSISPEEVISALMEQLSGVDEIEPQSAG